MNYTNILKNIWNAVYNPSQDTHETIIKFFHPDYEQCINGIIMKLPEYIEHVTQQKKNMTINSIDYQHILENGNELFAIYYVDGKNADGSPIKAEVIAYFRFEDQQIIKIHGQVRLIQGDLKDVDMH